MQNHTQGRAPNYTSACLVMGLVNLIWVLGVIWVWKGLAAVLMVALGIHLGINHLQSRMHPQQARITSNHGTGADETRGQAGNRSHD